MNQPNRPDHLTWVDAFMGSMPYGQASGMQVAQVSTGHATVTLPARPQWTGDALRKLTHPGVLTVLADTACGLAVGTALEVLAPFATLDLRMDYLRPAVADRELSCQAHCHRLSRNVAFVRGELRQPGQDEVLATVHATFMRGTAHRRRDAERPREGGQVTTAAMPAEAARATELPPPVLTPVLDAGLSPYVDFLGVCQNLNDPASPLFCMPFKPALIGNPVLPALHGGVLAGFAESAMVLHLIHTMGCQAGSPPRSVDFSIDYLRSAKPVDTFAQATTVRQGNRVALLQVSLWQDDPLRPVAMGRGHFLLPDTAQRS